MMLLLLETVGVCCLCMCLSHPLPTLYLKLQQELRWLVPPYIALDFDQHAIAMDGTQINFRVGSFQTIEHLARPLYV